MLDKRDRLGELEEVIERGLTTFVEVGNAIREIRDSRLYKESHGTFEDYCRERWGWSRVHAHRQMEAASTVGLLPTGNKLPNERIARELAPLVKDDAKTAGRVLDDLVEEHGDKLTGVHAKKAVQDVFEATAIREELPPKTRAVLEETDPECSMPRNPAQAKHLRDIANKRGDERAAETAERVANGEFKSTFEAYPEIKPIPPAPSKSVAEKWHGLMHDVLRQTNGIRDLGGIQKVAGMFSERDKEVLAGQLEELSKTLESWASDLKGNQ